MISVFQRDFFSSMMVLFCVAAFSYQLSAISYQLSAIGSPIEHSVFSAPAAKSQKLTTDS
jgi:hypothetical protein